MIKNLILATTFVFVLSVYSQELDEDFLESLPDDIKKDLMENNAKKGEYSEENYRPYLYSSKLSQAEELLELKDRLELDLLELERRLSIGDLSSGADLELYGSDFFNTFQTTFMPINEPNPDSGYSLDVGDILNIQLRDLNVRENDWYGIYRDNEIPGAINPRKWGYIKTTSTSEELKVVFNFPPSNYVLYYFSGDSLEFIHKNIFEFQDIYPPRIKLIGDKTINLNLGDAYNEPGVDLYSPLNEGDNIVLCDVGAYGKTLSSNYNLRTSADEILIKNSKVKRIKRKEKLRDII